MDSDSDFDDECQWFDDNDDEEIPSVPVRCLFCSTVLASADEVFKHCQNDHQFDINVLKRKFRLDCYGYIKMINYIRKMGVSANSVLSYLDQSPPWVGDEFLMPVDTSDPLLQYDIEDDSSDDGEKSAAIPFKQHNGSDENVVIPRVKYEELLQRLQSAEAKVESFQTSLEQCMSDLDMARETAKQFLLNSPEPSVQKAETVLQAMTVEEDDAYFSSYGHFDIHEQMLKDKVRTESYRDFMYKNPGIFKDKVVLDVGCGTGILSMFAARAGARRVISVDQSDIIYQAMDIVRENKLDDVITLVKGRVEDVALPVEKVDIIISEWMGYFLLFESMLDTVLLARDKWLAPGGRVFPDGCDMHLCGTSDASLHSSHVTYWDDVYGFKMSCMRTGVLKEALVTVVSPEYICTEPCLIKRINCEECHSKDLNFKSSFSLKCQGDKPITALVGYFVIDFHGDQDISFSTAAHVTPTHWKQTVFLLETALQPKDGQVDGTISVAKNRKDPRALVIVIEMQGHTYKYLME